MKTSEIEIQVQVEKLEPLLKLLEENGTFIKSQRQLDEYYSPKYKSFVQPDPFDRVQKWLRIRVEDDVSTYTFKNFHYDEKGNTKYCDEYETEMSNASAMRNILGGLEFEKIISVDKMRKTWKYNEYEVSIDQVKELGDFVEVEYYGNITVKEYESIRNEMYDFLKQLGCGKLMANLNGYPYQLLFPNKRKVVEV